MAFEIPDQELLRLRTFHSSYTEHSTAFFRTHLQAYQTITSVFTNTDVYLRLFCSVIKESSFLLPEFIGLRVSKYTPAFN